MAAKTYQAFNGHMQTTAPPTGTSLTAATTTTVLQLLTSTTRQLRVVEWGVSFNQVLATPAQCELINTGTVAATVTAFVAADITKQNSPNDEASTCQLSTIASGFLATAEGTVTSVRTGDYQQVSQQYLKQFPLGREFEVGLASILRVRITSAAAATVSAYVSWEE